MAALVTSASIGRTANFIEVDETVTLGVATATVAAVVAPVWSYTNGNSATTDAINQWWEPASEPITLAASASVTYTLTSLTDNQGRTMSFAGGVRGFSILVTSRTAGDYLTVGAAATNPWTNWGGGTTPTFKVYDFHCNLIRKTDKFAVAAGSNEQLKIVNSGSNSISFRVQFFGCLT